MRHGGKAERNRSAAVLKSVTNDAHTTTAPGLPFRTHGLSSPKRRPRRSHNNGTGTAFSDTWGVSRKRRPRRSHDNSTRAAFWHIRAFVAETSPATLARHKISIRRISSIKQRPLTSRATLPRRLRDNFALKIFRICNDRSALEVRREFWR